MPTTLTNDEIVDKCWIALGILNHLHLTIQGLPLPEVCPLSIQRFENILSDLIEETTGTGVWESLQAELN
jgi:hypothetical protein